MNKLATGRVWLFILLWLGLVGCIGSTEVKHDEASSNSTAPATSITPSDQVGEIRVCHLLDCFSYLRVQLTGNIPTQFVIEVTEPGGSTFIGSCFPTPEDIQFPISYRHEGYGPEDVDAIRELQTALGDITFCSQMGVERVDVFRRLPDEDLHSLFVACSGVPLNVNASVDPERLRVDCPHASTVDFVDFGGFTPSEMIITVYEGKEIYKGEATPSYTINTPNGPECPPTCRSATVTVNIP